MQPAQTETLQKRTLHLKGTDLQGKLTIQTLIMAFPASCTEMLY